MKREFTKREKGLIGLAVALAVFFVACIGIICLVNHEQRKEEELNGNRYVVITDEITGHSYAVKEGKEITINVRYDGLKHTFAYSVKDGRTHKKLRQHGYLQTYKGYASWNRVLVSGIEQPDTYYFEVSVYHDGFAYVVRGEIKMFVED